MGRFDHALDFERVFAFAKSHDEGTDTDPHLSRALNYVLARQRFLGDAPPIDLDLDADRSLARVVETNMVGQFTRRGLMPETLGRADLAAIRAYLLLAAPWLDNGDEAHAGQALADFDAYLVRLLGESGGLLEVEAHEIAPRLRRARQLVQQTRDVPDEALRALAARVINDAAVLTTSFLSRRDSYDPAAARVARLALTSAIAVTETFGDDGTASDSNEATDLLRGAIHSMYLLQARVDQHVVPSEILLLARA